MNKLGVLLYKDYILVDIVLGYMQLKPQLSYIWKEDASMVYFQVCQIFSLSFGWVINCV